jgi:FKBP-type peptidyl-prolyl cis-trans isomerase FklB
MKFRIVAAVGIGLTVATAASGQDAAKNAPPASAAAPAGTAAPKDLKAKASYSIGWLTGSDFKKRSIEIDGAEFARGLMHALEAKKSELTDAQIQETLQAFQQELAGRQQAMAKTAGDRSLKEGEAFLAANKTKPGVKTLPDGLQYKVIKDGTGRAPKATDTVSVHYRGTLIDGTPFDSSYDRGMPANFPVNGVIPGWTEALQLMKEGSKWQLFIPSELAYGAKPRPGGPIPPNAVLIFDVELLKVE